MAQSKSLATLFLRTIVLVVALTGLWSQVSRWTSQPVATLTHIALEFGAPYWVESVHKTPDVIEVQTRLQVRVPVGVGVGVGVGEVMVEARPSHYAYSLPILWALLLAAGGAGRLGKLALGYVMLLPAQAFSLTLDLLKQMAMAVPGGAKALAIAQWQLELIGLGYQLGTLILPTVVPIVLWVVMDRSFVQQWVQFNHSNNSAATNLDAQKIIHEQGPLP